MNEPSAQLLTLLDKLYTTRVYATDAKATFEAKLKLRDETYKTAREVEAAVIRIFPRNDVVIHNNHAYSMETTSYNAEIKIRPISSTRPIRSDRPTREMMIEALLNDALQTADDMMGQKTSDNWLRDIFGNGVKGYNNFTDEELAKAYKDAGLDD
jgi:hypothetical protein